MFGGGDNPQFYQDMMELMTTDKGMDLVRQVVAQQGTAVQKQQASKALVSALQNKTSSLGQPIKNTAVLGMFAPSAPNSVVFQPDQQQAQGLPTGFVIEQQSSGLPAGFILDRRSR